MTNAHSEVAVVVVSYNTRDLLIECISSVVESAKQVSTEIIVIDNASEDGSYEAIRNAYPQTVAIQNSKNLGFAAACNQGIQATSSPLILLLNSDAKLTAAAFSALCDCLKLNHRCAAAGCRLIDSAGVEMINARNFLTPLNQALETAGLTLKSKTLSRTYRPRLDANFLDCSVEWIDGACLMLKRKALEQVGLFDERFFMYSEDEDLSFRLKKNGWTVCFCGAGTAVHHGAESTRQSKASMLRQFYESQLLFLAKHRSNRSVVFYKLAMKTILFLKRWLLPERWRRKKAREHLIALREACAFKSRGAATS